jgi:hypothetical protein
VKTEKNNRKNWIVKKNRLEFWKNQPVRFRFYKTETEKTELNPNRRKTEPNWKKPSQNQKNRAKPKKLSQIGLNRFFPKNNRTEPKLVGLNRLRFLLKKPVFVTWDVYCTWMHYRSRDNSLWTYCTCMYCELRDNLTVDLHNCFGIY